MGSKGEMESKGIRESEGVMNSKGVAMPSVRGWGISASTNKNTSLCGLIHNLYGCILLLTCIILQVKKRNINHTAV